MVQRFLERIQPTVVALMELEVWPNLAQACQARGIPLVVINGRLSESSFGTYRWAKRWVRPMFQGLTAVAAQTQEYAQRFRALGTPAGRVTVTDTMKWDTVRTTGEVEGARELADSMGIDRSRPLLVAGSTGPGEEALLLRDRPPGVQLLLVPRKPERFDEVARLAPGIVRRSRGQRLDGATPDEAHPDRTGSDGAVSGGADSHGADSDGAGNEVFLLDTMGELTKAYSLADVAIVGRSFVPLGGSDPIEPVALGKPTLIGPRHENFRDVVAALEEAGGLRVVEDPMAEAVRLLGAGEEARRMAEAGRGVIRRRQGATERHARLLLELLGQGPVDPGSGGGQGPEGLQKELEDQRKLEDGS
jgi:3-deoxy-D-manno-octulosonic-acid transferase